MRHRWSISVATVIAAAVLGGPIASRLLAQSPTSHAGAPAFASATVTPNAGHSKARAAGFESGGRFTAVNASLYVLVVTAYRGVWPPQAIPALQILGGPDWTGIDGFDVDARAPNDAPGSDATDVENAVGDRFALKAIQNATPSHVSAGPGQKE